ncbi:MAG TPA: helix-turn-helix domain-containing protein [Gemmatimonadaceae bacterium]|nr:helix-turn-helix domain-containing protein [Gemmatimonadaceae bacterium]HRQ77627.1 helix-turn-helix domain-containing protein [Gemmatimonadaceae bacterium]
MRVTTKRELGIALREFRRRRGLTQAAVAEQLGVSRRWVNHVELAKTNADFYTVLRALKLLGAELEMRPIDASAADEGTRSTSKRGAP